MHRSVLMFAAVALCVGGCAGIRTHEPTSADELDLALEAARDPRNIEYRGNVSELRTIFDALRATDTLTLQHLGLSDIAEILELRASEPPTVRISLWPMPHGIGFAIKASRMDNAWRFRTARVSGTIGALEFPNDPDRGLTVDELRVRYAGVLDFASYGDIVAPTEIRDHVLATLAVHLSMQRPKTIDVTVEHLVDGVNIHVCVRAHVGFYGNDIDRGAIILGRIVRDYTNAPADIATPWAIERFNIDHGYIVAVAAGALTDAEAIATLARQGIEVDHSPYWVNRVDALTAITERWEFDDDLPTDGP